MRNGKILKWLLLTASLLLGFMGISSLIDTKGALAPRGISVDTITEANELTAVYGGIFVVLSALCLFASGRVGDIQLQRFISFAFLFVGFARVYAAARYGLPASPSLYASFGSEMFFGFSILFLSRGGSIR